MNAPAYSREDLQAIRERVKYEDEVLNNRTGIILTINGLVAIADVAGNSVGMGQVSSMTILLINVAWLLCAVEAWRFIARLSKILRNAEAVDLSADIRLHTEFTHGWLRVFGIHLRIGPTATLGFVVPLLLVMAWGWVVVVGLRCF
jgi:hypothetical protein